LVDIPEQKNSAAIGCRPFKTAAIPPMGRLSFPFDFGLGHSAAVSVKEDEFLLPLSFLNCVPSGLVVPLNLIAYPSRVGCGVPPFRQLPAAPGGNSYPPSHFPALPQRSMYWRTDGGDIAHALGKPMQLPERGCSGRLVGCPVNGRFDPVKSGFLISNMTVPDWTPAMVGSRAVVMTDDEASIGQVSGFSRVPPAKPIPDACSLQFAGMTSWRAAGSAAECDKAADVGPAENSRLDSRRHLLEGRHLGPDFRSTPLPCHRHQQGDDGGSAEERYVS
jgi:hypothetical protein